MSKLNYSTMAEMAKRRRQTYEITPNLDFVNTEFGYYSLDAWREQGKLQGEHDPWVYDDYMKEMFYLEDDGQMYLNGCNWEASEFYPRFEQVQVEDLGDKEIAIDEFGRSVLYFKKSRSGYMPEYVDHPVKDLESFKEKCLWRLNPKTKQRYIDLEKHVPAMLEAEKKGTMMVQRYVGGFMYLRSLMGPEDLLYMVYDDPDLIHTCMEAWFELADAVTAYHQQYVTLDELFFGEDITYNQGPLISHDMIREFILPYYKRLIDNTKARQIDKTRKLYLHLDTDGLIESVIPTYAEIGFDVYSPFEVASGSFVTEIGKKYPNIVMTGGIDKREFSKTRQELTDYLQGVLPDMKRRGGYIPTCDHGVPEEADFDNYRFYRKFASEL